MSMLNATDLLQLACDLTAGLAAEDRHRRLMDAINRVIPCEAAALLRLEGGALLPVASTGLVPELMGRRFDPRQHPRLACILGHGGPLRFPPDSPLPDPYDGLMLADPQACARVHACMGCPLTVEGRVIGVLTVDSRDPSAFAGLSDETVATFAAMAAASLHTANLIDTLERTSRRQGAVLKHLVRDQRGARLIGTSPAMQRLREEIDLVAGSDLAVLISGETGTGKELVAAAIHAGSRRHDEPLVQVNCAALPEHLVESELFGHVRGAFTGASADRAGTFEVADDGTLFLDEVGELPLAVQPKLLRALQQGQIQRIGAERPLTVDVRVIAATNRDLRAEQAAGRFRADLYHRIAVYPLTVPPLRERREDIPLIAGHVLEREGVRLGCAGARLDSGAREALLVHAWPGNVRELEHVLMRAMVRAAGQAGRHAEVVLGADHLALDPGQPVPAALPSASAPTAPLRTRLDDFTRTQVADALARHQGRWAAAGRELGLTPSNLIRLANRLGLRSHD